MSGDAHVCIGGGAWGVGTKQREGKGRDGTGQGDGKAKYCVGRARCTGAGKRHGACARFGLEDGAVHRLGVRHAWVPW